VDRIVKLLFVLRVGDGVVGAFGRSLVGCRGSAVLDSSFVGFDDVVIVYLERNDDQQQ
jgi:hypothetical protein